MQNAYFIFEIGRLSGLMFGQMPDSCRRYYKARSPLSCRTSAQIWDWVGMKYQSNIQVSRAAPFSLRCHPYVSQDPELTLSGHRAPSPSHKDLSLVSLECFDTTLRVWRNVAAIDSRARGGYAYKRPRGLFQGKQLSNSTYHVLPQLLRLEPQAIACHSDSPNAHNLFLFYPIPHTSLITWSGQGGEKVAFVTYILCPSSA
jgi:hypothetical protein